jgi:hypothetical protein
MAYDWPRSRKARLVPEAQCLGSKTRRLFCPTGQGGFAKIFIFPKDRNYGLTKSARLDTGDVMAIRHQT